MLYLFIWPPNESLFIFQHDVIVTWNSTFDQNLVHSRTNQCIILKGCHEDVIYTEGCNWVKTACLVYPPPKIINYSQLNRKKATRVSLHVHDSLFLPLGPGTCPDTFTLKTLALPGSVHLGFTYKARHIKKTRILSIYIQVSLNQTIAHNIHLCRVLASCLCLKINVMFY